MSVLAKCVLVLCAAVAAFGFELGANDVVFHLLTRNNPSVSEPLLPTINSIASSNFLSLARRTIITIHSNGEGVSGNFNAFVVPAHLAAEDVNVIAVDWSRGSTMYTQGLGNAPQVGRIIADFIGILQSPFNYNPELIRIVGVGLGGHIAGIAAKRVGTIPHIVAIDPSLVGWTHHPDILSPEDAGLVEVLHASAGFWGYDYPLGDLDFYPNGGSIQNGCTPSNPACSQTLAYAFYAESLTAEALGGNEFVGTKCEDYEEAISFRCHGERNVAFGGPEPKIDAHGIYFFTTNLVPPFAQG